MVRIVIFPSKRAFNENLLVFSKFVIWKTLPLGVAVDCVWVRWHENSEIVIVSRIYLVGHDKTVIVEFIFPVGVEARC